MIYFPFNSKNQKDYNTMDLLPSDLVYECLNFLDSIEYYEMCKYVGIPLKFNLFFKNYQKDDIIAVNVCNEKKEYVEIIEYLLSNEFRYNWYMLRNTIKNGHLNILKLLHSLHIKFNHNDITLACEYGNIYVVKFLYSVVGIPLSDFELWVACKYGHFDIIKYICTLGITPTNNHLYISVINGNVNIIKYLCSTRKIDKIVLTNMAGNAKRHNHIKLANYLYSIGAKKI